MVDINLIGDDKKGPEDQEGEQRFTEPTDLDRDDFMRRERPFGGKEPTTKGPYMDSSYVKKSPKSLMYILVGGCAVLFIMLLYLLLSPKSEQPKKAPLPEKPKVVKPTPEVQPKVEKPVATVETQIPIDPLTIRTIAPSLQGIKTVRSILSSSPTNLKFTMISYSRGNFLIESFANSAPAIDELSVKLNQNLPSSKMKIESRESKQIGGKIFQKALISGVIPEGSGVEPPRQLTYLKERELQAQLKKFCSQYGLVLKNVNAHREIREDRYKRTPIFVKAFGNKESALNFLEGITQEKLNINLSKIVLVASDLQGLDDNKVNLILNIDLYEPI